MSFILANPNPKNNLVGDCVIRAISLVDEQTWDDTFIELMVKSFEMKDIPSANNVWGSYLHDIGYRRNIIPNTCPDCYRVKDFIEDNPTKTVTSTVGTPQRKRWYKS